MKSKSPLLWLIPLILLLLLVPFLVPSALTYAGAEEADLPVYSPVELDNPHPEPLLPLPGAKTPNPTPYKANPEGFVRDEKTGAVKEYRDGTIYVKIESRIINNTKVLFTWIQIADPSQLRTFVTGETNPVRLADKIDAIVAINGDWYSGRPEGTVYRNAVLMRPPKSVQARYDQLIIDDEGNFHILRRPENDAEAFAPYECFIMHSFIFGPGLVIDGKLMTDDTETFEKNRYGSGAGMGLDKKAQRQAICQMGSLSYLIITTEGPNESKGGGFTATELAELAYNMGAVNAYNLDGGNSTCLVVDGVKMNRFGKGGVRNATDLIYFITAEEPPVVTEAPTEAPTEIPAVPATPETETEGSIQP
ncbi:MAG: phosphodiester glycosidase family protein [Clostridiales bacterium]|nr:phosphodiester glycosidase family protein [Clostridiales bacterium]